MKRFFFTLCLLAIAIASQAKSLIVYYSFTNNVHTIVNDLKTQIDADVLRIEPTEKGLDYAANGYAIGSAQISAIRNHPNDASSYPAIDPVEVDISQYDMIIVATPLWWGNMAAPMQSFLFQYGQQMTNKPIGLIVSSASSGISGVVSDAKRLIPQGDFTSINLHIRSSQTSSCHSLISQWLENINYTHLTSAPSLQSKTLDNGVVLSTNGVSISGLFDKLSLYTTDGRKLLDTSSAYTPLTVNPGSYIVQIKKDNHIQTIKAIAQ